MQCKTPKFWRIQQWLRKRAWFRLGLKFSQRKSETGEVNFSRCTLLRKLITALWIRTSQYCSCSTLPLHHTKLHASAQNWKQRSGAGHVNPDREIYCDYHGIRTVSYFMNFDLFYYTASYRRGGIPIVFYRRGGVGQKCISHRGRWRDFQASTILLLSGAYVEIAGSTNSSRNWAQYTNFVS